MSNIAEEFMKQNFYYTYLKGRLEKGQEQLFKEGTLIVGSSHGLCGIQESVWPEAINCSMHSQDIFYDCLCIKRVLDGKSLETTYKKCFLIMGYYMPFQDLSLSKRARTEMISRTYYPIFRDAHNWEDVEEYNHWNFNSSLPENMKEIYEKEAVNISKQLPFYSEKTMARKSLYDFGGRSWKELSNDEKKRFGSERAKVHNLIEEHKESYSENLELLVDMVDYLRSKKIQMTTVVAPYTREYCKNISYTMRDSFFNMMEQAKVPTVIDFNDEKYRDRFEDSCFMDMDHLNEKGSMIFSKLLAEESF